MAKRSFGAYVRWKREQANISLRSFAEKVGVSATYISLIEQGKAPPPAAQRVQRMAAILHENPDDLLALAGKVADDLKAIIHTHEAPAELASFLRHVKGMSAEDLERLRHLARIKDDSDDDRRTPPPRKRH